jgi:hypothetical protein|tara:strand:- start:431 stop:598 length:168 start_codon:yes stop_codon:yes gene_type:complete
MHFAPALNGFILVGTAKAKADHNVIGLDNKQSFVLGLGFEPLYPLRLAKLAVSAL